MTGIEKDTIAEITNIVSKTASIVKIWHNVFFKSTLLKTNIIQNIERFSFHTLIEGL